MSCVAAGAATETIGAAAITGAIEETANVAETATAIMLERNFFNSGLLEKFG